MSYYDKKYIKGEHKKYECKGECKKEYHKYEEKEEEKGLLTEFDVDQAPSVPLSFTGVPSLTNQFAEVEVCVDDRSDRVALDATIEWQPNAFNLATTIAALIAFLGDLPAGATLPLAIPATFRIWRRSSGGTVLISQKTDTSPLAGISVLTLLDDAGTLAIPFGTVTTSIHAVDTDPGLGENEYFLTINLGPFPAGTVIPSTAGGDLAFVPLAAAGLTLTPTDNVFSYTLTASEIEENE